MIHISKEGAVRRGTNGEDLRLARGEGGFVDKVMRLMGRFKFAGSMQGGGGGRRAGLQKTYSYVNSPPWEKERKRD